MHYVRWTNYTAQMSATAVRDVTCEKCRTRYAYAIKRSDFGTGTSIYGLDDAGAERRAANQAAERLREALDNAIELVPCPNCGHYQPDMSAFLKRAHLKWLAVLGGLMIIVALAGVGAGFFKESLLLVAFGLASLVLGIAMILYRQSEVQKYDPNAGDPEARKELGRSLAFMKQERG